MCGKNERLKLRTEKLASKVDIPVKVFGFTDQMPLLMDAADVVIGKPGPGTIAEAIAKELPMLIDASHEPMAQEKGNLEMVVRQQLGLTIERSAPVADQVRKLMENQELYQRIQENLRRAKNDKAIEELIDVVLTKMPGWTKPSPAINPNEPVGTP
ncbi:undecaprenyldiphospho-muramoylpentapeptide beta-N- acetylglucosaminyltransferase [compost metagenome]